MIVLPTPTQLPLIRVSHDNLSRYQPEWLLDVLEKAARRTDDVPPWLAEDISKGVESYLRNHYDKAIIDVSELFDRIRSTLIDLGLESMAAELMEKAPPIRISLTKLAREAGAGYELAFFNLLNRQFASATGSGSHLLICYGLRKCVKHLVDTGHWNSRCEALKSEIIDFLDHEFQKAAAANPALRLVVN